MNSQQADTCQVTWGDDYEPCPHAAVALAPAECRSCGYRDVARVCGRCLEWFHLDDEFICKECHGPILKGEPIALPGVRS